jgi:peptide/nickel transport system substrate-binding protein
MKRLMSIGVILVASLLAAACGTSSSSNSGSTGKSSSSGPSGVLTIDNESGSLWTCNFSPYNLSDIGYSFGPVYEPLVFVNTLQSAKATPWLASSWQYGNGNKTLTFTIRNGVKFSDGTPMSAKDVVFSFNLLKKFKALDINAVWSVRRC